MVRLVWLFLLCLPLSISATVCEFPNLFVPSGQAPCECGIDDQLSAWGDLPDALQSSGQCLPYQYCFVQKDQPYVCYQLPCDDIGGSWLLYDASTWQVLSTVEITQTNCQATLALGSNASVEELSNTTWYGTLRWAQNTWRVHAFALPEYRNAYETNAAVWQRAGDDMQVALFMSDRKSGPVCFYEGSTNDGVFQGGMIRNQLPTGEGGAYAVGDVLESDAMSSCPSGYPRGMQEGNATASAITAEITENASAAVSLEQFGYLVSAMAVASLVLPWF